MYMRIIDHAEEFSGSVANILVSENLRGLYFSKWVRYYGIGGTKWRLAMGLLKRACTWSRALSISDVAMGMNSTVDKAQ